MSTDNWEDLKSTLSKDEWDTVRHDYGRKRNEWEDANDVMIISQSLANKLTTFELDPSSSPFDDLPPGASGGIFIAKVGNKNYLVNTEGYDYARYIVQLNISAV